MASGGGGSFSPPQSSWTISGAAAIDANLAVVFAGAFAQIVVSSSVVEEAFEPDYAQAYGAIWTRDHAYTIWHNPTLLTAAQRRQFISHRLATVSSSPANFVADRITTDGTVTYKNLGTLPHMDGIAFVVLACWADWTESGSNTAFATNQAAIDACMAATPRSVNGCVYSDPAHYSVYYGFTDGIIITGDDAMGTAMHAWAYKMLDEMSGGGSSTVEADTYANLRAHAESGLATLRNATTKFYKASSVNSSTVDYVWATALAVAEELVTGTDRTDSAQAIADAYNAGTITQNGFVRHLYGTQGWPNGGGVTYLQSQNGGYWMTPLWDCVRAVDVVDPTLARTWAAEALTEVSNEAAAQGTWTRAPYEWRNTGQAGTGGVPGYTASAAIVHRFI